ncbi:undecaprenyl-phosphate glucose phosphotransferase, partial [Burkholderia cenocepacia]|nr:undecaprenyl-phosphate glucose phosphotransferase [Burkholderia cenocepacia]
MSGGTNAMRRAAIAAADVVLVLAGALVAQAASGLGWHALSDAQRGAIALLCVLTVALLPRYLRTVRGGVAVQGGAHVLTHTLVAVVCASVLTVAGTMWIMNRGGTVTTRWIVRTVLAGDAALLLGRAALLALALT